MGVKVIFNRIFNTLPLQVLEKALEGASLRHKVISNNIANVNTPGYKKMETTFEDELTLAAERSGSPLKMTQTHPGHLSPISAQVVPPQIRAVNSHSLRTDGNNVDIDSEMAAMAKNNIYYNAVAQKISSHYSNIKAAIKGG